MPLRTYPLISHPAFLRYIEDKNARMQSQDHLPAADAPRHRPILEHAYEIAEFLNISPKYIRSMLLRKSKHYRVFSVQKRSGGERIISAPRTFLKVVQWWILDTILSNSEMPSYVYGFLPQRSFIDNARAHVGANYVLNIDIKSFFPSVRTLDVFKVFRELGYSESVSLQLTELTTFNEGLPQGAPTSPSLSNFVFRETDRKIRDLCINLDIKYTRYADDMTFSSNGRIPGILLDEITFILSEQQFLLNNDKTKWMGINRRKEVTGLIIGRDDVALKQEFLNGTRGWFNAVRRNPLFYTGQVDRVNGTLNLIKNVGGRGSPPVIRLGEEAVRQLTISQAIFPSITLS